MRDYDMDGTWQAKVCSGCLEVTASQIRHFFVPFDVTRFFRFFEDTAYTIERILRKMRRPKTFHVSKCILGVTMTIFNIYTLISPKKPF